MLEKIKNTTCFIRSRLGISPRRYFTEPAVDCAIPEGFHKIEGGGLPAPEIGIILGSGLGALAEAIEVIGTLEYAEIPDFPRSTVPGHKGRFIYGRLGGKYVIAMEGRVHFYEGYPIHEVVLPVRAMCCLGISTLVVSNAAGGLCPLFNVGDIMVIDDQINLIPNPLIGPNIDELGTRFPDMKEAYDPLLIRLAHATALAQGITLRQGCYVGSTGPTFETPAEYRYFQTIGADATGMSTTPEVIVARHQGIRVLGFSLITNVGVGQGDHVGVGSHQEVMEAGRAATPILCRLVESVIEKM